MSGAVGSPFTAAMFRFDGVKLQETLLYVNNKSCIYSCDLLICLFLKAIYFSLDRFGNQAGRVMSS